MSKLILALMLALLPVGSVFAEDATSTAASTATSTAAPTAALVTATTGSGASPATSASTVLVFDNALDFCEHYTFVNYVESGRVADPSIRCAIFSKTDKHVRFSVPIEVFPGETVILRGLELEFVGYSAMLRVYEGGSLYIDGGHYSNLYGCVVYNGYVDGNYTNEATVNIPFQDITIKSGTFESKSETNTFPICFAHNNEAWSDNFALSALERMLEDGSHYTDFETGRELTEVTLGLGQFHKNGDIMTLIHGFNHSTVTIIHGESGRGEVEPEPEPEPTIVVPKTPNTGRK